jgi:hypothetical protein
MGSRTNTIALLRLEERQQSAEQNLYPPMGLKIRALVQ